MVQGVYSVFGGCMRCFKQTGGVFFALFVVLLSAGCSGRQSGRWERCEVAYNRAVSSIAADSHIEVDVIWLLQKTLEIEADSRLEEMVDSWIEQHSDHPYLLMVDSEGARLGLLENPGVGIDKYFSYVKAALGFPERRATQFVEDFVRIPNTGYILTHQLAALIWSKETNLKLDFKSEAVWGELIEKMAEEHVEQGDSVCVDLYAERTALLLKYGNPSMEEATGWVGKLVNSQNEEGTWPESTSILEYDGQFATARIPPSHTAALALLSIKIYMKEYLSE